MSTEFTSPELSRKRIYREGEKVAFLAAYGRLQNVADAAREAGVTTMAGYRWLVAAGINPKRRKVERRAEYDRLRTTGISRQAAAKQVGVHIRSAIDWDQGVRKSGAVRIHPSGRVAGYKYDVPKLHERRARLTRIEQQLHARYLSLVERERIRDLSVAGLSVRSIAAILQRSASTISRELRRNATTAGTYEPYTAHRIAAERRPRPKTAKLVQRPRLRGYVQDKLRVHWSPEQICHALIRTYPADQEMRVSPETIYQALYLQARGGLRKEVQAALRTGRARRKTHNTGLERRSRFVDPMIMIADRPPQIEDRAIPGHWEGDLITGTLNQSAIGALVERTTRYVMLVHLPHSHTAEAVRDGLVAAITTLPEHLRGSLTWDQGSEMATHKSFTTVTDMPVYFCDPASPWQRGSNENTNGLLRQYFPKSTDLSTYGLEDLERVAQELNARPRKTLGWDTPAERIRDLLTPT
jgi:IS30 family transposase